jgi:hypothetical protein
MADAMTKLQRTFFIALLSGLQVSYVAVGAQLTVKATNKLPLARASQTLELSAKDLAPLGESNLQKIHVKDAAGNELLCQAVDTDFDAYHKPDIVIFQADFAPGESKIFMVSSGSKHTYKKEQFRAHGRFVRERFDDFAWENDRIAHRMYGRALETWAGELLTSSAVDIWSKRVPQMVIDEWYMVDNYHVDSGQGADFYSAGTSRGCGGTGFWADGKLWVSKNFVDTRVLADGPLRVMFELVYEPFEVNGIKVSEIKRITLDAGSNFDHFQSFFKPQGNSSELVCAIGLKKVAGEKKQFNPEAGTLVSWEKMEKNQGMQGIALVVDPKTSPKETEDKLDNLVLVKLGPDHSVSYWAGFAWDKSGQCANEEAWRTQVYQFAKGLESPIEVRVGGE